MRRILQRLLAFFFFFVILTAMTNSLGFWAQKRLNKTTPLAQSIAFVGHSHVRTGISDSLATQLLQVPCKNFGVGGQGPFWSVQTAEKLIEKGVPNIVLNLTNNSLSTEWKSYDQTRGQREFYLKGQLGVKDWLFLFQSDLLFASELFFRAEWPNNRIKGGFLIRNTSFEPRIVSGEQTVNRSLTNFAALRTLIEANDGTQFVLIRIPNHPSVTRTNEDEYQNLIFSLQENENVSFIDFADSFTSDSLFSDMHHLNFQGAMAFTETLADSLSHALQLP